MNPREFSNIALAERDLWWFQGMRRILFGLLDPVAAAHPVSRVLEAGCGTGYFGRILEQRYDWRVCALDLAPEGVRYARQLGLERIVQGDVARLPFPDSSFDVVLSLDVLVHFPRGEDEAPVRELVRVLAPEGTLVLRVAALDALRSRHSQFTGERQRFTRDRLRALVERHGMRVTRCTYANSLLLPVALAKFRLWEPLLRKPPASGLVQIPGWLNRLLRIPLFLEAAWIRAGGSLPAGQSLVLVGRKA